MCLWPNLCASSKNKISTSLLQSQSCCVHKKALHPWTRLFFFTYIKVLWVSTAGDTYNMLIWYHNEGVPHLPLSTPLNTEPRKWYVPFKKCILSVFCVLFYNLEYKANSQNNPEPNSDFMLHCHLLVKKEWDHKKKPLWKMFIYDIL